MATNKSASYRILSIDGGGIRGIIPLVILERLDTAMPGWRAGIAMYAGTSSGGLIALCLANGMRPRDILDLYMTKGAEVFSRSLWHEIKEIDDLIGPKFDSDLRLALCTAVLGTSLRLGDLAPDVLITAFDLDDRSQPDPSKRFWKAKIFHNMQTVDSKDTDVGEYAYRVAMRTSAAPTYFSSYDGFVDGGVFANNPSMCALAQTQDPRLAQPIQFESVRMLSIGTGFYPFHLRADESWGLAQWAPHFVHMLMDGVNEVADFQVKTMLTEKCYCRIRPWLEREVPLDAASQAGALRAIGTQIDIDSASAFIRTW